MATETKAVEKMKSAVEREAEAFENAHKQPIEKQFTSAELAEAQGTDPDAGPALAPEPAFTRRDPNLDPNVKSSVTHSTAGPARTETTRAAARDAGLVNEAKIGAPATTINSQGGFGEAKEARDERVREANKDRASSENTTPNAAEQDEKGQTKPEVVDAIEERNARIEESEDIEKEAAEKASKRSAQK